MKNSWIKKVVILLTSLMLSSILFFVVISVTYYSFFRKNILDVNGNICTTWTASVDNRLNTIYEHVYDLSATVFNKTQVRSGSDQMDYKVMKEIQDAINLKVLASSDITALYVLDTESDLFLYSSAGAVNSQLNYALKLFLSSYSRENAVSINNKEWDVVEVLERGYYVKAFSLGKYVIGAASDVANYAAEALTSGAKGSAGFVVKEGELYHCFGNEELSDFLFPEREAGYFSHGYAVSPIKQQSSRGSLLLVTKQMNFRIPWRIATVFLIGDSAICVILVVMLIFSIDKRVRIPVKRLVEANEELSKGNLDYRLDTAEAGSDEFEELFGSFNEMSGKIGELTIESYELKINREENRLKMLRAQMQPHTFLNAITTISNMTYTGKPEDIRKYISSFARFTRYMLHTAGDWTLVGDELQHIRDYVEMQKIRFPESIEVKVDVDDEVMTKKIPFLILFSLVENSFKHAMTLVKTMYITITGETYEEEGFKGIRLIEEDNGAGFTKEALDKLTEAESDDTFTKEHLGLTNVRYSLNLIYGRADLLRISNKEEGGARIELLIPREQ